MSEWFVSDTANILSEKNLGSVRHVLETTWVVGLHYHYGGGRGPDRVAFRVWSDYLAYVESGRAGDLFIFWSVADIQRRGLLLAGRKTGDMPSALSLSSVIENVKEYLSRFNASNIQNEFSAVGLAQGEANLRVLYSDLDRLDALAEMLGECSEWYVLPASDIDLPGFYLMHAKRPNENGEVPTGGAY